MENTISEHLRRRQLETKQELMHMKGAKPL